MRQIIALLVVVAAACSGAEVVDRPATTLAATTTTATTTTTTTSTTTTTTSTPTTSTPTTTMPPTTTMSTAPPASGFYVVPEAKYGAGVKFTSADLGYPESPGVFVGYVLDEGDEVLAPFDGDVTSRGGEYWFDRWQTYLELTSSDGVIMFVLGDAAAYSEESVFRAGDVLATIRDPETHIGGSIRMNVAIMFYRVTDESFAMDPQSFERFFTFLFPPSP